VKNHLTLWLHTACYNTVLVCILLKQIKFKLLLKICQTGCVCVVECSLYAPCWMDIGVCCRRVGCSSRTCWWFTNPYSTNGSKVPQLCISLLLSSYMFQINCHHQGANTYTTKTQFKINTLQHFKHLNFNYNLYILICISIVKLFYRCNFSNMVVTTLMIELCICWYCKDL